MSGLRYFWYWDRDNCWPPPTIQSPEELTGADRLCVACTQTRLSNTAQRRLVERWCEVLPSLDGVEYLWLNSRTPQQLFDAACRVPSLKGLWVKWSAVESIDALSSSRSLLAFHLGSSSKLRSIDALSTLIGLRWLGLENVERITSLEPLRSIAELVGLAVEGSTWSTQHVETLEPIGDLAELRYLSLVNLRAGDQTLEPLFRLRKLETFEAATWWDDAELAELRRRNPRLAGDPSTVEGQAES